MTFKGIVTPWKGPESTRSAGIDYPIFLIAFSITPESFPYNSFTTKLITGVEIKAIVLRHHDFTLMKQIFPNLNLSTLSFFKAIVRAPLSSLYPRVMDAPKVVPSIRMLRFPFPTVKPKTLNSTYVVTTKL